MKSYKIKERQRDTNSKNRVSMALYKALVPLPIFDVLQSRTRIICSAMPTLHVNIQETKHPASRPQVGVVDAAGVTCALNQSTCSRRHFRQLPGLVAAKRSGVHRLNWRRIRGEISPHCDLDQRHKKYMVPKWE